MCEGVQVVWSVREIYFIQRTSYNFFNSINVQAGVGHAKQNGPKSRKRVPWMEGFACKASQ